MFASEFWLFFLPEKTAFSALSMVTSSPLRSSLAILLRMRPAIWPSAFTNVIRLFCCCGLHFYFHRIIFTFEPFGFFSRSSLIGMYFDFAASSFALAASEASKAASVIGWSNSPEPRILPGTTTTSAFVCFC